VPAFVALSELRLLTEYGELEIACLGDSGVNATRRRAAPEFIQFLSEMKAQN
jgi:hypothetical protein